MLVASADPEATYHTELLPAKLEMDLAHLERRTLWTDLVVILGTLRLIARD